MKTKVFVLKALVDIEQHNGNEGGAICYYRRGEVFDVDVDVAYFSEVDNEEVYSLHHSIEVGLVEVLYVDEYE